jgi:hypothetical protein
MGQENLLDKLQKHLKRGEKRKDAIRCDQIDIILEKLERKEQKLRKKLALEKDKGKRKKLDMEIRIISLQRKKGIKRRKEWADRCKS